MWISNTTSTGEKPKRLPLDEMEKKVGHAIGILKGRKSAKDAKHGTVFLTGDPGSGKTYMIGRLLSFSDPAKVVCCLATTHRGAKNLSEKIGSKSLIVSTVHSWIFGRSWTAVSKYLFSCRKGSRESPSFDEIYNIIVTRDPHATSRWVLPHIIIIDEVSLCSGFQIDLFCYVVSRSNAPCHYGIGGKAVLFIGDFMQLPPVEMRQGWAFQSESWKEHVTTVVKLQGNLRMDRRDPDADVYRQLLTLLRLGRVPALAFCKTLCTKMNGDQTDNFDEFHLVCTKAELDDINDVRTSDVENCSTIRPSLKLCSHHASLKSTPKEIQDCVSRLFTAIYPGDCVMIDCTVIAMNSRKKRVVLTNGLVGKVLQSSPNKGAMVQFGESVGQVDIPLVSSPIWDECSMDTKKTWEWFFGTSPHGCPGDDFCSVQRLPLSLGRGCTVHKAQGLTLNRVTLHCRNLFVPGQFYVGASRVMRLRDLKLLGENDEEVKTPEDMMKLFDKNRDLQLQGKGDILELTQWI
eukprot:GHVH01008264.1.p1 GENE.GHVH01008264.1~~GHVH01008264.1.p1  ORF type:complete len:517 (-),score=61.20 GHVH01008264.1:176-1726(-)